MKTQISFFEIKEQWQRELIKKQLPAAKFLVNTTDTKLTPASAGKYKSADVIVVFIHSHVDEKVLSKTPKLKFIATSSTGYDHIDIAACKKRGIKVANVPFYGENTVAEHTFALILAITRKIVHSVNQTKQGKFTLSGLRGFDLKGKTIGVVGTGHIGEHVIRIAHGFEMKILAFDVKQNKALENHYPLTYVTLDKLLSGSDITTIHAPYNQHTHHLINSNNLKKVKHGAILINTSRGGLVDTSALFSALKSGRLGGAGLDVLEEEGIIGEESELLVKSADRDDLAAVVAAHKLLALDNVIVTPHNAFNSQEAVERIMHTTLENILAWQKGKPQNTVESIK